MNDADASLGIIRERGGKILQEPFFRFLRQPNSPIAPRPVAKSGRAAGSGVAELMVISPFEKMSGMSFSFESEALVLLLLVLNIMDTISAGAPGGTSKKTLLKPKVAPEPISVA